MRALTQPGRFALQSVRWIILFQGRFIRGGVVMDIYFGALRILFISASFGVLFVMASTILKLKDSRRQQHEFRTGNRFENRLTIAVGFVQFVGTAVCISGGVYFLLWFMPDSWGGVDEGGDWTSARFSMGCFAGFYGAVAVFDAVADYRKQILQVLNLKCEIKLFELKGRIDWSSGDKDYYQSAIEANARQMESLWPRFNESVTIELKARQMLADELNNRVYCICNR